MNFERLKKVQCARMPISPVNQSRARRRENAKQDAKNLKWALNPNSLLRVFFRAIALAFNVVAAMPSGSQTGV
jgi:hypothetical protein